MRAVAGRAIAREAFRNMMKKRNNRKGRPERNGVGGGRMGILIVVLLVASGGIAENVPASCRSRFLSGRFSRGLAGEWFADLRPDEECMCILIFGLHACLIEF